MPEELFSLRYFPTIKIKRINGTANSEAKCNFFKHAPKVVQLLQNLSMKNYIGYGVGGWVVE